MTNIRPLSPALAEQARKELNENPKTLASDLEALKQWLAKQPHIIAKTDDQFLTNFLRLCKYSLERTKERLDMYFALRTVAPEFFTARDTTGQEFTEMYNLGSMIPLPKTQPDGSRIILTRFQYDPHKKHLRDFMSIAITLSDYILHNDDQAIICGETILVDVSGLTLHHIAQATPTLLQKVGDTVKEAYPSRHKGIHFIKPPTGFETIFKMFQSFLSEKLTKRLFVHGSLESLHEHVSKSVLPAEYGGELGPLKSILDNYYKGIESSRQWLLDDMKYRTDERVT